MAGTLYGVICGKSGSTTCDLTIPTQGTLNLIKSSGEDYWTYETEVAAGNYNVTAKDTTSGAGGNEDTLPVTVNNDQWVELNFDIS